MQNRYLKVPVSRLGYIDRDHTRNCRDIYTVVYYHEITIVGAHLFCLQMRQPNLYLLAVIPVDCKLVMLLSDHQKGLRIRNFEKSISRSVLGVS